MRIVAGHPWTIDGRWVVLGELFGHECIVFDPDNGNPFLDIQDCLDFVNEARTRDS